MSEVSRLVVKLRELIMRVKKTTGMDTTDSYRTRSLSLETQAFDVIGFHQIDFSHACHISLVIGGAYDATKSNLFQRTRRRYELRLQVNLFKELTYAASASRH